MTISIFLGALLGAMALGVPIAFALLICGVALMWHLALFDPQILAQNLINGADSYPLLAVPAHSRRSRLRHHHRGLPAGSTVRLRDGRRGRADGAPASNDGGRGS